VGWQKAAGIAMLGDKVGAEQAEKMGMIYAVYLDQDFAGASLALVSTLAQLPTRALALTKHALNYSATNTLEAQLRLEDELQQQASKTQDYAEGVDAFLNKRAPLFKGE